MLFHAKTYSHVNAMPKLNDNKIECGKCNFCSHCMYDDCECHLKPKTCKVSCKCNEEEEKIEKGAKDFANRFEGVMKELAEEDTVKENDWEELLVKEAQKDILTEILAKCESAKDARECRHIIKEYILK